MTRRTLANCFVLLVFAGCGGSSSPADSGADGDARSGALHWFKTCGAPLCPPGDAGVAEDGGTAACSIEKAGDPCSQAAAECDPRLGCGVLLVCADKDPKVQSGGCPISRRASKTEVSYLDRAAIDRLMAELRELHLATYRYRDAPERLRLGFMIDDSPHSLAIDEARDQIDLYSYLSMAVGALQAEAARADGQEQEIRTLRRRLKTLEKRVTRR